METHTLLTIKGPLCADRVSETVDGTNTNFSTFSWAERRPGQHARNQTTKARVSIVPVTKMGVLLRGSPASNVLVTWACGEVPSGLSLTFA